MFKSFLKTCVCKILSDVLSRRHYVLGPYVRGTFCPVGRFGEGRFVCAPMWGLPNNSLQKVLNLLRYTANNSLQKVLHLRRYTANKSLQKFLNLPAGTQQITGHSRDKSPQGYRWRVTIRHYRGLLLFMVDLVLSSSSIFCQSLY